MRIWIFKRKKQQLFATSCTKNFSSTGARRGDLVALTPVSLSRTSSEQPGRKKPRPNAGAGFLLQTN
jgi:hypothetical protein